MLIATAVQGTVESLGNAALTALLGYGVVFLGLFLLMIVVIIMGKIMVAAQKKQQPEVQAEAAAPVKVKAAPAPGTAGQIKLYDTTDRDAAMIMAIVADKMGKPLNELRFISIKEVK